MEMVRIRARVRSSIPEQFKVKFPSTNWEKHILEVIGQAAGKEIEALKGK